LSINLNAQESKKSFMIDDIIKVTESDMSDANDFLKSRFFHYYEYDKTNECSSYGLNLDKTIDESTMWCYKYKDGRFKILESDGGGHLSFIKTQLKNYKLNSKFDEEGVFTTTFKYKNHYIFLVENEPNDKYELFVNAKL
jgi:hypothetical protein